MTVPKFNNAILRVELEPLGNHAIVWLATWGVAGDTVAGLNREWARTLGTALR
jgi:hypothetical protein